MDTDAVEFIKMAKPIQNVLKKKKTKAAFTIKAVSGQLNRRYISEAQRADMLIKRCRADTDEQGQNSGYKYSSGYN